MHPSDIAQFKFSSGQEIVCEVMEWPENGERDIIIRNAMAIVMGETSDGDRIYMFKPWVHYLESPTEYIVVNSFHVISQNRPNENLMKEYASAVNEMHTIAKERDDDYREAELRNIRKFQNNLSQLFRFDSSSEEEQSNVVKFPSKDDTVH